MKLLLLLLLLNTIPFKSTRAHKVRNANINTSKRNATSSLFPGCISGNCSQVNLLANITSDVTIYITTNMVLSSVIQFTHLKNIAIIGYNNPTVQCGYSGGLNFVSCHNVTIEGIIWNECGANTNISSIQGIGLYMYNSSNTIFLNCTFQNSLGQSIVLSEMLGNVNINNCNFTHNSNYKNHGTAIHCLSKLNDNVQLVFTINNCVFDYSGGASIVYFYQPDASQICLSLQNSKFTNNQGVPIYIINGQLYINGVVLFEKNNATNGGGLFVGDHASVIFNKSSVVTFSRNVATNQGGAVFVSNQAMISFEQNSIVVFNSNRANKGGAVFSKNNVTIKGNSEVTFNNNSARLGGAVYCNSKSIFLLVKDAGATFTNNNVPPGEAINDKSCDVTSKRNATVTFSNNKAHAGGAIYIVIMSIFVVGGDCSLIFCNNNASEFGGAISMYNNITLIFEGSSVVLFNNNVAKDGNGGAIKSNKRCRITFQENATVTFTNNVAKRTGGAAFVEDYSYIACKNNSVVLFNSNSAGNSGGSIDTSNSNITFEGNCFVKFSNNYAELLGGAIFIDTNSVAAIGGNSFVTFCNNKAQFGGAGACVRSTIILGKNSNVTFSNNKAERNGGAASFALCKSIIKEQSLVTFLNNTAAADGGGVEYHYNFNVIFMNNSSTSFIGNFAAGVGGAIASKASSIKFTQSSKLMFYNNTANLGGGSMSLVLSNSIFEGSSVVIFERNHAYNGGAIQVIMNSNISFYNNCRVVLNDNKATITGGAGALVYNSVITFRGNCSITIANNSAMIGGGIYAQEKSQIYFEYSCITIFTSNYAEYGGAIFSARECTVTISEVCKLKFYNNTGVTAGGAVFITTNATFVFKGDCTVTISSNVASKGGGVYLLLHSVITFKENSTVELSGNNANMYGGAIYSKHAYIHFEGKSCIKFSNNRAPQCGAVCSLNDFKENSDTYFMDRTATYPSDTSFSIQISGIIFKENTEVLFNNNQAKEKGGAISCFTDSSLIIIDNSVVKFVNNRAHIGGAMYLSNQSSFTVDDYSLLVFNSNAATLGGSLFIENSAAAIFKGNSLVKFNADIAADYGGAIMSHNTSVVKFEEQTRVTFEDNIATIGGAMYSVDISNIFFTQFCTVLFHNNSAKFGENIYTKNNSHVSITRNSTTVRFNNNTARWYGGVSYSNKYGYADIVFDSNGTITCSDPKALPVCVHQNCFCEDIDSVLVSLTNNTQIDLSVNVTLVLSSIIMISGVNISIIGHHNPTINCSNSGGLKFTYCHNCTIKGIIWDGCGAEDINSIPVIEFYHSTNITIQNCTFQHSAGRVVVLSEVSGNVKINHCSFLQSKCYKGHGTAIYYSPSCNFQKHIQLLLTISNSNFSMNEATNSIVYIGQFSNKFHSLLLIGCTFSGNKGISLYLSNQNLHIFDNTTFDNNKAELGAAVFATDHSTITFSKNSVVTFNQNTVNNSGGAIFLSHSSSAIFEANCFVVFNNNIANHNGGSIFAYNNSNVVLRGNSSVQFNFNTAKFGGALNIATSSVFIIVESSLVFFNGNKADLGGAVYFTDNSTVQFKDNLFTDHTALLYSTIKWHETTMMFYSSFNFKNKSVMSVFINNSAIQGGAVYVRNNSILKFKENYLVIFVRNRVKGEGGSISCYYNSSILFEDKSQTIFSENKAKLGGALYLEKNGTIVVKGNSSIEFAHNKVVLNGGAVCFSRDCDVKFDDNSIITFHNNEASQGGAVYSESNTNITIGGQSKIIFTNNNAKLGGAVYCCNNTIITATGNSFIMFANNAALEQGGGLAIKDSSDVKLKNNSALTFKCNKAVNDGGSVHLDMKSGVHFEEHCTVTFDSNTVEDGTGGAISSKSSSVIKFKDSSLVIFHDNNATQGGAIYSSYNSSLLFCKNTLVTFRGNVATIGGALNIYSHSCIEFQSGANSTVTFDSNKATQNGGAICLQKYSDMTFKGTVRVQFYNNKAVLGGAINCNSNSDITSKESPCIKFLQNIAKLGGAIYTMMSNITIKDNSKLILIYNLALQDGGALFLDEQFKVIITDDAEVMFSFNTASDYGGAIYSRVDQSVINFNITNIYFDDNYARTAGSSVFINVPTLCNSSCLNDSVLGVTGGSLQHNELSKHITTSPRKLELYKPAECINDSSRVCDAYYVKNIMLGQEILIDACMYDYYDRPTGTEEFLVNSADGQDYFIPGSQYVLISCNHTFQGIYIIGNKTTPVLPFNYTLIISLYVVRISEMKTISVNLMVELSPCHPGFWYDNTTQKCECYNSTSIVLCSGSSSTIKKGYWFGSVTGKPTVTFCPVDYCNFTCCETINGHHHLSPVRDNQCVLHRSGTACGDCEVGYSLSFDSTECINVTECTIELAILLVILMIFYWVIITVAVFVMMYFKVEIGYLYGITYYYSIVDILLSQNWFLSSMKLHIYTLINIMSSITKITPQFLGHLCLVQGMSGIDQQFVHYMHPLAVSLIVVSIIYLARKSSRLSFVIRRGIIRFICFLLLLSYTSVATTSLLILRPLTFHNVDKTYTYLSPEIEYFHGRHLVYGIVSVLLSIVIVIGLPFLLLFEPFLNRRINFVKIKPLLDQFQGCFKDKYRCFAAYYMICRLGIIVIIIVNSPNDFITHYLIITVCVIIDLLHHHVRPYADNHLNLFDGDILHLTILVAVLPLVEFSDSFDLNLVMGTVLVLVLLPLVSLVAMTLWIYRTNIKIVINYFSSLKSKHSRSSDEIPLNT